MTHFEIVHDVDCDVSRYWDVFFDEAYNQAIYAKVGVKERIWLDGPNDHDGGRKRSWKLRIMPTRDLPEVVKKIVKGDLGYVETSTLDLDTNIIHVKIEPTLFTDRTTFRAEYRITPLGPGRLRRTFEGDIHVDWPLVGRKIEAFILSDVERSYETVARLTSEWCAAHP
jgi:hypothetical protein